MSVVSYLILDYIRSLNNEQRRSVPVIALTAAALKEVKEKVFASGMDDFLTKPFNPAELRKKLESHILNSIERKY